MLVKGRKDVRVATRATHLVKSLRFGLDLANMYSWGGASAVERLQGLESGSLRKILFNAFSRPARLPRP